MCILLSPPWQSLFTMTSITLRGHDSTPSSLLPLTPKWPWGLCSYYFNEETTAQRGEVTCPGSHGWGDVKPGFGPLPFCSLCHCDHLRPGHSSGVSCVPGCGQRQVGSAIWTWEGTAAPCPGGPPPRGGQGHWGTRSTQSPSVTRSTITFGASSVPCTRTTAFSTSLSAPGTGATGNFRPQGGRPTRRVSVPWAWLATWGAGY